MTGPELQALAARLGVNPYYLGYALATQAASIDAAFARDGGNHKYTIWNNARWTEQAKAENVHRDYVALHDGASDRHIALIATFIPLDVRP